MCKNKISIYFNKFDFGFTCVLNLVMLREKVAIKSRIGQACVFPRYLLFLALLHV